MMWKRRAEKGLLILPAHLSSHYAHIPLLISVIILHESCNCRRFNETIVS